MTLLVSDDQVPGAAVVAVELELIDSAQALGGFGAKLGGEFGEGFSGSSHVYLRESFAVLSCAVSSCLWLVRHRIGSSYSVMRDSTQECKERPGAGGGAACAEALAAVEGRVEKPSVQEKPCASRATGLGRS